MSQVRVRERVLVQARFPVGDTEIKRIVIILGVAARAGAGETPDLPDGYDSLLLRFCQYHFKTPLVPSCLRQAARAHMLPMLSSPRCLRARLR